MTASSSRTPSAAAGCDRLSGRLADAEANRLATPLEPWNPSASLIWWVAALSIVRLVVGGFIPLTDDEAYYRLWASHPSMGYFDHPPMVAWWIALGRAIFGDTPFAVRFLPTISTAAVTFLVVDIGRFLGLSRSASDRAGVWYNATLLIALAGEVCTPDAPATLFWTATIWAVSRAYRTGSDAWWALAGVTAGLAALSKYSALFIGPGLFLWLIHSPQRRQDLLKPWPWTALPLAILIFSPNAVWNAQHGWLSFAKQFSRVAPSSFTPVHVIDFPATQFVLLNPVIAVFACLGVVQAITRRGPNLLLALSIAPFLAFLVAHSFHAAVQAHWTAPLYPPLALLAAAAAEPGRSATSRAAAAAVPWIGFLLAAVVMAHIAFPQTDWFGRKDAVMTLRGWPSLAADVETERRQIRAGWIGTFNYTTAAKLLNERRSAARVLQLNDRARYGFEGAGPPLVGPGLVVELDRRLGDVDISDCFGRFTRLKDLHRGDPGTPGTLYRTYRVDDPRVDLLSRGCVLDRDRIK